MTSRTSSKYQVAGFRARTSIRGSLSVVAVSAFFSAAALSLSAAQAQLSSACAASGAWIDVKTGRTIDRGELVRDLAAKSPVVLLGESHTDADDHYWQLHTLAELYGRGVNLVIGFEAFPRRLQNVLDDWVAGKLTDDAFLKASEWRQVWGYDAALYMPLFQFARLNHIPMIALNVERSLVARVGQQGWRAVPASEREGLSDPAPAAVGYQRELARVFAMKKAMPAGAANRLLNAQGPGLPEPGEAEVTSALNQPEFERFVDAQLTWDRAMAEALADAKHKYPDATVVGILGSGHVESGYGVPHQLRALGIAQPASLIPVAAEEACKLVGTSFADFIFTLPRRDEAPAPERPRLGVELAGGDDSPRINRVVGDSVAELAGLKAGDHVVRAAGLETRNPDDLVEIIARQAPGTWLPLSIRRDGQEIDLVAKFPARLRPDQ